MQVEQLLWFNITPYSSQTLRMLFEFQMTLWT